MFLVTTGLPETWCDNDQNLLLGEWCREFKGQINNQDSVVVQKFHWKDRFKLARDYEYLGNLNNRLLTRFAIVLNTIHQTSFSERYWRIVLGPWLNLMTPILWDRYENLRLAFTDYPIMATKVSQEWDKVPIPDDYVDLLMLMNDDGWNHRLYSKLIREFFTEARPGFRVEFVEDAHFEAEGRPNRHTLKQNIGKFLDACLSKINFHEKVVAYNSYFDLYSLTRLLAGFKQLPRKYTEFSQKPALPDVNLDLRNQELGLNPHTEFERYLDHHYLDLLPVAYLEGYSALRRCADKISYEANVILSAVSHYNNDLFKIWTAGNVEKGSKLFICEHGGGIPYKMSLTAIHEEIVSDRKFVWHKEYNPKHLKLPPSKLIKYSGFKRKSREFIALVGWDVPKYPYYIQSGPVSSLALEDYAQKRQLIENLDTSSFDALIIRPAPGDSGWHIREKYISDFGNKKISPFRTMDEMLHRSKLVVCTYPSTNMSEAIEAGIPTILLYNADLWELRPEFDELVSVMFANKIFFSDSLEAAAHINTISADPDAWWNSIEIQEARNLFHEYCGKADKGWLDEWSGFLKKQLVH